MVNGVQHASLRDLCAAFCLLAYDDESRNALRQSYASRFHPITELFLLIIVHCKSINHLQLAPNIHLLSFHISAIDIVEHLLF